MGFIKKIAGVVSEVVNAQNQFEIGTQYLYANQIYKVTQKQNSDHMQMRIVLVGGEEQIFSLNTLRADLKNGLIQIVTK